MTKVSVIVPIYNGELYLRQCLDSIVNQTLKELEIICVDDGSTDSSLSILEEYQKSDDRIRIIRQQNLHAGIARNNGMKQATGEYLAFWDCDDFFNLDALKLMYERAEQVEADICVCGGNQYFEEEDILVGTPAYLHMNQVPESGVFNRESNEQYILTFTNGAIWNKLFRNEFVKEEGIDFNSARTGEDIFFTLHALCAAKRVTVVNKRLINYRVNRKGSLVNTLSEASTEPIRSWMDTAERLIQKDIFPEQSFVNKALGSIIYILNNIQTADGLLKAIDLLKKEGFEGLHFSGKEREYFYVDWQYEWLMRLRNDEPIDFIAYMKHLLYTQSCVHLAHRRYSEKKVRTLRKKNRMLKEEIERVQNSRTFRCGEAVLYIPKKVRKILK